MAKPSLRTRIVAVLMSDGSGNGRTSQTRANNDKEISQRWRLRRNARVKYMMQLKAMTSKTAIVAVESIPAEKNMYARIEPDIRFQIPGITNSMASIVRQPESQIGPVGFELTEGGLSAAMLPVIYYLPMRILRGIAISSTVQLCNCFASHANRSSLSFKETHFPWPITVLKILNLLMYQGA